MENDGFDIPGPGYDGPDDLTGSSEIPLYFSHTPFSIQIQNNYSSINHHWPTDEQKWACPSAWSHDFNTHDVSGQTCFDLSDSGVSLCPSECYSGVYDEFLSPTPASHTWTSGDRVLDHTTSAEPFDTCATGTSGENKIFTTLGPTDPSVPPIVCPGPPDEETAGQHKDSICSFSEISRKPCHCTKSQCLKLYCDCFAAGEICRDCSCVNCSNNMEHATARNKAVKLRLRRNPDAFRSKINSSVQRDATGRHTRGCNCKSSGCLKNYCECYKAQIMCSAMCKCVSCSNFNRSEMGKKSSHPNYNTHSRANSVSCITDVVVSATCGCLLAEAEEAVKRGVCGVQAERATLEEFGFCLTQIVHFMFKHTHRVGADTHSHT